MIEGITEQIGARKYQNEIVQWKTATHKFGLNCYVQVDTARTYYGLLVSATISGFSIKA